MPEESTPYKIPRYYRDEYGDIYEEDDLPDDRPVWALGGNDDGGAEPYNDPTPYDY
jgi:hypothetical protein